MFQEKIDQGQVSHVVGGGLMGLGKPSADLGRRTSAYFSDSFLGHFPFLVELPGGHEELALAVTADDSLFPFSNRLWHGEFPKQ